MTRIVPISAARSFVAPTEKSEPPASGVYRLTESVMAVHFEKDGHGRIVCLPKGAELQAVGFSALLNCLEVMWEGQLYSVFKVDVLRASSGRIESLDRWPSQELPFNQRRPR